MVYSTIGLLPILILAAASFVGLFDDFDAYSEILIPNARRAKLLLNSFVLSGLVSLICVIFGWGGAVFLWRLPQRISTFLAWLLMPLLALPSHVYAMTWLSISSFLKELLGLDSLSFVQGWWAATWIEVAAFSPLALGIVWLGLRNIDPELIEASRMLKTDMATLIHVVLPLSAPVVVTGGGIIFLFSLLEFSVPSLFQINVYSLELFAEFSATNNPERVFILSLPLIMIAIAIIIFLLTPIRNLTLRFTHQSIPWKVPINLPRWAEYLGWGIGIILILQFVLPSVVMIVSLGSLGKLFRNIGQAFYEIGYSLKIAGLAGLFSLPIAIGLAKTLSGKNALSRVLWPLVLLPLAMPGSLIGISLIYVFNLKWLRHDALLSTMPVLALLGRFLPVAALILVAQFRRVDTLLLDAARLFQPSRIKRNIFVNIPMFVPGLFASFGMVFAFGLGELSSVLMVVPPGKETLTMRIYNYLHYGASDSVLGLGLLLTLSVFLTVGGIAMLNFWWSKYTASFDR